MKHSTTLLQFSNVANIITCLHSWAAYMYIAVLLQCIEYIHLSLSHLCNPPGICTWLLYMKFGYKTNDLIANLATMFLLLQEPLGIEGGAIYRVRYPAIGGVKIAKIAKITMEKYTIESVIRGHHVYIKSIWHPILGEQLTLEREDGNSHDRHQTSRSLASTSIPQ